ncbi:D-2-hydroxyacid dehydrogenase [Filifactor alocis]|uniref:D-2-hydroxyacid dehydrogenase n=1 Tax=Filifactor alocis TaxID=143361 RepID=UPI002354A281
MKCLITELVHPSGVDILKQHYDVTLAYGKSLDEVKAMVKDYEILIVRSDTPVQKDMIDAGVKLKVIGMAGIGLNHIDTKYAEEKGIKVFNVKDGSIDSVAELALTLMLTVMRKVNPANNAVKQGKWDKMGFTGNLLTEKTVGILAVGRIGSRVAQLCQGFGCNVIGYDPYLPQEVADKIGVKLMSLDEVLQTADILSIHMPLTPETKHMIGKKQLDMMKEGSFLFNLGRGGLVDEDALYDALKSGHLAGAGLDVVEVEPPAPDHKLFELDNCIITCHIGAGSYEAQEKIAKSLANQIIEYLSK